MPRGFYWMLILLGLGTLCAQAEPEPGFIGVLWTRPVGADFLLADYVAPKSPADAAGIRKGDQATAIYGMPISRMSAAELKHAMEADAGSTVTWTIRHEGAKEADVSAVARRLTDTYMPAVNAGDTQAMVAMGYEYDHGPARIVDKLQAWTWYNKAAAQGNAAGERSLGILYFYGAGAPQSDKLAFAWFCAAAAQDDSKAEYYLGQIYQHGRGVPASNESSFYWYNLAAQHGNPYAEWNLGFAYEKGWGVKASTTEALKWFQKAAIALPDDRKLKGHIAMLSMTAFVENPDSASLDTAAIMAAYGRYLTPLFYALLALYVAEILVLFYFSFRAVEKPVGLIVALAWLFLFVEGQFVALFALFVHGATLTAGTLFIATCLFCALPVIISTLGMNRRRIWKASSLSSKKIFAYAIGSYAINLILFGSYGKIYAVVTGTPLPAQPTEALVLKTIHGSVFLAYLCIAVVLPLAEEILFRGYFFDALKKYVPDVAVIIITALGFALVHLQGLYIAPIFGFGLVQGWLRLKTGSLRLPALMHVLNNGLLVAVSS
jgi:membrane protease YdiL (CAAX protease family)